MSYQAFCSNLPLVLALFLVGAWIGVPSSSAAAENLLQNGELTLSDDGKAVAGWTLSGPITGMRSTKVRGEAGEVLQLRVKGKGLASFSQTAAVAPSRVYRFSIWVKSDGRFVARVNSATMSYHRQGEWQQLVGLIDPAAASSLALTFQLSSLDGQSVGFMLRDAALRPAEAPPAPAARPRGDTTTLVDGRKPAATIVYPAHGPAFEQLAQQVQDAIKQATGVALPMVSDTDATDKDHPVLLDKFRGQHLILIGRLGINRALWPAYNRFLAASDGYYPGGDGYVVRTAANVYHDGYNHLILGGSSDAGVERAVERFIEIVGDSKINADGTLPWLLDVELGGECKVAFDQRDAMWEANILDPMLPKVEPGYGTVRRWYENAMSYYWSGRPEARQRAQAMIEPVLKDQAYTHHYITEFLVRTWDMMDNTDVYTDQQRAAMDALIQQNFWDFQTGPDVRWMTTFSPPYNNIGLVNRHQISPWTSDLYMAEFVKEVLEPEGDLAAVAEFRAGEKNGFMHHLVTDRWEPSPPGGELVETHEESAVLAFRYALDHEQYQFFDSDNARKWLALPKIDQRTGRFMRPGGQTDSHLILGKLASYYQDGRYLKLLNELPMAVHQLGPFQGRYVNGVHRYTPGPELKEEPLDSLAGVMVPEVSPHGKSKLHEYDSGLFKLPKIDPDDVFDFAAFRGGFSPDDDYLAVNGINGSGASPGVLVGFSSRNVSWLNTGGSSLFNPPSEQYFDQHGVHVLRTDRWRSEDDGYAAVAKREWVAAPGNAPGNNKTSDSNGEVDKQWGGVEFSLSPFMGTKWTRQVLWIQSGLFIVRDTVTALNRGDYQVAITWRPGGAPTWDDGTWISRSGSSELRITPLSQQFITRQNVDAVLAGEADAVQFRQMASATLSAGESVSSASVMQAFFPGKEARLKATQPEADAVVLHPDSGGSGPMAILWGPRNEGDVQTDAAVVILDGDRVRLIEGSALTINGQSVLKLNKKQSVAETLDGSAAQAVAGYLQKMADAPTLAAGDSGDSTSQVLAAEDQTAAWSSAWTYEGLLRPGRVNTLRNISAEVVDLGRVVQLDEIRARGGHRIWKPSTLPESIWVAVPDANNRMPTLDSDGWTKIDGERRWRAGVKTANYGGATPVEEDVQLVKTDGIEARYVRAESAGRLVYFDRAQPEARRDLLLEIADVDGDGSANVFVKPDIWPKFIRSRWDQDDAVALLHADGRERFQAESTTDYQEARLLNYSGGDGKQAVLVSVDGKIDIMSPDGEAVRRLNLYDMLVEFNETEGRPNTRHPAGGLPMPYSIGTWRRGSDGTAALVVSRYGTLSFIDPQGNFEGVQMPGGYVTPTMLSEGVDFDGDGSEEQLVLSRGNLLQVHGDNTPYVTQPNGSQFYPQVYKVKRLKDLAWTGVIDGPQPIAFESFDWAGTRRTVFVARNNYLGVYDGKLNKWAFGWVPLTKLTGAALAESTGNKLTIVAATADGLLWRMSWTSILNDKPKFSVKALADPARRVAGTPEGSGPIVIVGEAGLYRMNQPGQLEKIADGSFVDARFLPADADGRSAVVATTGQGKVVRYDPKP